MDIVPVTEAHPLPDGEVRLLGAVRGVTGAMTRIEIAGVRLLVDCGVAQGRERVDWRFPDAARDVDAVLLTHGHLDHVGSLPALLAGGWEGPILSTRATFAIARIVLRDGLTLEGATEEEADALIARLDALHHPLKYDAREMPFGGVAVAFREAGHILGSASIELVSGKSRVIVSGDLGRPDTPILRTYNQTWDAARPVDLVVLETTYGDREHASDHAHIRQELGRILYRAIERGGYVLVPAFAIGRTQVLLYHLNALVESGYLAGVPVVLDSPMGLAVTETYSHFRSLYDKAALERLAYGDDPLDFEGLYAVMRPRDSERLHDLEAPAIVIASSGMCTGGRIVGHLVELLPHEETCVLFVGYQAEGTPGRAILEAARARDERGGVPTVTLDGVEVEVRASVEMLSGLSAHADRGELRAWLDAIPDVRRVALHHGEVDAQEAFARWVQAPRS
ncbi:MAG: MBL fold metallo-hydrolase [Pseudomonadota bacterium]|nr:MBL fold metallo-hydrolase [Pseudomonadota bacterium]